jgi:hypothetical protein
MPLTRNLYELDEVVSALQVCLRRGYGRAAFWLWELVVSKEETLALNCLTDAWLRGGGGYDPQLLTLQLTDIGWPERYVRIAAAIKTARERNATRFLNETAVDPSRPYVTPLAASEKARQRRKERSAAFVASLSTDEPIDKNEAANWWISFDAACRQHHSKDAIWLLQAVQPTLSADAIWSAIQIAARGSLLTKNAIELLKGAPILTEPTHQVLAQANAVLLLCTTTKERETTMVQKPTELLSYRREWATWSSMVGRRKARIHAIPAEALHGATTRGAIPFKYTNIADVRDPVTLFSDGSTFWRIALQEAGVTVDEDTQAIAFPDDDVLEAFYQRYFPDDIPDEWSAEDQAKSHGRGCQDTAAAPPPVPEVQIREEPLNQRGWNMATHVRFASPKNLKA